MSKKITSEYKLYDDPFKYFNAMLEDIGSATESICLEVYRFNNDSIGIKFKDMLTRKSMEGVKVKILVDSWGTSLPSNFFRDLIESGGEVRFFLKFKLFWDFFTKNHRRNHRKLLIIDDDITYIGSANITEYSLNWRESMLRIKSDIAIQFRSVFEKHYNIYNKYVFEKQTNNHSVIHDNCEIIGDVPSYTKQRIRKRYLELIKSAKQEVIIETPYFLPGFLLRKAIADAARRNVKVKVIIPKHSDVRLIDILRNKYLGLLHKSGVEILFYLPHNLHAKILLVDQKVFSLGSPNFDYRSFRYQHEIVIVGSIKSVSRQVYGHLKETMRTSEKFNFENWKKRSPFQKFMEWTLLPFRHLL